MNCNTDCEPELILTSDLNDAYVSEWEQIPTSIFQHLVKNLPVRVKASISTKGNPTPINALGSGIERSTSSYRCSVCPHTFDHVAFMVN